MKLPSPHLGPSSRNEKKTALETFIILYVSGNGAFLSFLKTAFPIFLEIEYSSFKNKTF